MYDVLARSKISLNVHVDVAGGMVGNIRMFETTGMGSLLISEDAPNASDLFRAGQEIVTYSGVEELVDKIEYYLDHDSERAEIARAGQSKTLNTHNTVERGKQIISIFERYL